MVKPILENTEPEYDISFELVDPESEDISSSYLADQNDSVALQTEILVSIQESNERLEAGVSCLIAFFALFLTGYVMYFAYKFLRIFF